MSAKIKEITVKRIQRIFLSAAGFIFLMSSVAMADGDIASGKKLAKKCKACHTLKEGGKNRLGPNLFGILNQPAGKVKGYKYSKAMSSSGVTWDDATFTDFVKKPKKVIKGTKMSFRGFKKAAQRADLLAYFKTLGGDDAASSPTKGDQVAAPASCCSLSPPIGCEATTTCVEDTSPCEADIPI